MGVFVDRCRCVPVVFPDLGGVVVGAMVGQSPDTDPTGSTYPRDSSTSQGADHQARLVVSQVFPFLVGGGPIMTGAGAI